ncbi:probable beta-1,3-galactosyltransferase 2, partial [Tanacetum coccineum]
MSTQKCAMERGLLINVDHPFVSVVRDFPTDAFIHMVFPSSRTEKKGKDLGFLRNTGVNQTNTLMRNGKFSQRIRPNLPDLPVLTATFAATLAKHRGNPQVYIRCMKSGLVLAHKRVRYHEPEHWKFGEEGNKYFRHATGQLYAISKDLATYISINQKVLHKYVNEDVSLGSWFIRLDVEHIDDRKLCCGTLPGASSFCDRYRVWKASSKEYVGAFVDLTHIECLSRICPSWASVDVRANGVNKGVGVSGLLGQVIHEKDMTSPIDYVLCVGHFRLK